MRVALPALLLTVAFTLAGCADANADDAASQLRDSEQAAADLPVAATAQTGVIRGVVVDDAIRPLAGALVELQGASSNTTSNEAGAFAFEDLEPGTYFLSASLDGYATVQQSVEVLAGVDQPEAVKILLAAIARGTPMVETHSAVIFVSGSGWVDGVGGVTVGGAGVLSDGNWNFEVAISPNGTVAQTELVWNPTSELGKESRAEGGTYTGNDGIDTETYTGPSPLIMLANATEGDETADNVYYSLYVWPSGGVPAGLHFNQQVDAYINVFYNFQPSEGWSFVRDGAHPVPA